MNKRKIGTLAAVAMLAFAACSGGGGGGASKGEIEIWSSLPRQGSSKAQTDTIVNAINMAIEEKGGSVGGYTIKYVDKDDSTAAAGKWDEATEIKNANDAVANDKLVAYIGTFNSGAAKLSIPILCGKGIVMISPANTGVGLTKPFDEGEPDKYYPNGKRNYIRIVAADDYQGASNALLAKQLGYKSVFVFNDKEAYGLGVATDFRNAAKKIGLKIAGFTAWAPNASSYEALANKVKQSGADVVYLGGLECENGSKLIKDLRGTLGASFPLIAPDGFSSFTDTFKNSGGAALGMYISVAGQPNDKLGAKGKKFVKDFGAELGSDPNPYSAYGAQSMEVMLQAISKSGGDRGKVADNLLHTKVTDGILGNFSINENGDTTSNPVTQYKLLKGGKTTPFKTITPPASLVKVA